MKAYVRLEILRTIRDPFYLFLAVVVPIGFYLLFSGLFGSETPPRGAVGQYRDHGRSGGVWWHLGLPGGDGTAPCQ